MKGRQMFSHLSENLVIIRRFVECCIRIPRVTHKFCRKMFKAKAHVWTLWIVILGFVLYFILLSNSELSFRTPSQIGLKNIKEFQNFEETPKVLWTQNLSTDMSVRKSFSEQVDTTENTFNLLENKKRVFLRNNPKANLNKQPSDFTGFYYNATVEILSDDLLHHHKFLYFINEENACKNKNVVVFSYVHSAANKKGYRDGIRKTWGSVKSINGSDMVLIFLLGTTKDNKVQKEIYEESLVHHDIVQGNFIDHYRNLTYKNVMGLHWMQRYCSHAKFILKADDDVIVNPYHLVPFLQHKLNIHENKSFLYCSVYIKQGPVRYKTDKWYMSEKEYPYKLFPNYCEGFVYIMSADVSKTLLDASPFVPFFWVDDVYVTGFLAYISGIHHTFFEREHKYGKMKGTLSEKEITNTLFFLNKYSRSNYIWPNTWNSILDYKNKFLKS